MTGDRGEFRLPDLDPGQYVLRATLEGFRPVRRPDIIVGVGASVEIRIDMVVADVSEEVVVSAATPVLDVKRQGNVTNFDQAMLNEIPTARDPWALMQQLPGVSIGRPNVGGSESTNQAQFAARGDNGSNTMWNIDGVTITDMAAAGASTTYYDFNVFEEAQFTTGGLDSRQQTGGLGINLVTKRGTSELRGAARLFFSNDDLQGENISSELKAAGLSGNRIQQLAEYGGDVGGPLWKERVWFWTGTSRTDIRQLAINGFPDRSIINTLAARGDAQLSARTRLSFLYHRGEKLKAGRAAGVDRPPETTWNQQGPTNIYKVEGSQIFGPALFLSAKFAYVDLEFGLTPQSGLNAQVYRDFAAQIWHGGFLYSASNRAQYQTQVDGNWSRGRHDVTFGLHQRRTSSNEVSGWPGDGTTTVINLERQGVPTGVGFANITRAGVSSSSTSTWSGYIGDVIALNRWTFNLGLRFDRQRGRNEASGAPANGLAPSILPALEYPGGPEIGWDDFSPRLGVTYRLTDTTILRGSYARFASQLTSSLITFDNAAGSGSIQYFFRDANGDHLAQTSELMGPTGTVSGVNPADPSAPYSPNQVDPELTAPSVQTVMAGVEREVMPNFSVAINLGHGYMSSATWPPFIGLGREDFVEYRTAGSAGGVTSTTPVYRLVSGTSLPPGSGRMLSNRDGYHQRYWNIDLVGTKRLANRWMVRGFLTLQQQREVLRRARTVDPGSDAAIRIASGGRQRLPRRRPRGERASSVRVRHQRKVDLQRGGTLRAAVGPQRRRHGVRSAGVSGVRDHHREPPRRSRPHGRAGGPGPGREPVLERPPRRSSDSEDARMGASPDDPRFRSVQRFQQWRCPPPVPRSDGHDVSASSGDCRASARAGGAADAVLANRRGRGLPHRFHALGFDYTDRPGPREEPNQLPSRVRSLRV